MASSASKNYFIITIIYFHLFAHSSNEIRAGTTLRYFSRLMPSRKMSVFAQSFETIRYDEQFGSGRRAGRARGRRQQGHGIAAVRLEGVDRQGEQLRRQQDGAPGAAWRKCRRLSPPSACTAGKDRVLVRPER